MRNEKKRFILQLGDDKWGSEHWLSIYFYDDLGRPHVVSDLSKLNKGTYDILILDDCIYSGIHLVGLIDGSTYDLSQKLGVDREKFKENGIILNFHIICALSTKQGIETIEDVGKYIHMNVNLYIGNMMETISDIVSKDNYNMNWKVYNDLIEPRNNPELIKVLGDEYKQKTDGPLYNSTTVWLEHKIANRFGSIPEIIEPVMKNKPDRSKIEESEQYKDILEYI
jgi:hypothetical protein